MTFPEGLLTCCTFYPVGAAGRYQQRDPAHTGGEADHRAEGRGARVTGGQRSGNQDSSF